MEQLSLFAPVGASEPSARVRVLASLLDKGLNKGLGTMKGSDDARAPRARGTSSWSFPGWAGIVYDSKVSQTTLARHGLAAYARHPLFRTVCNHINEGYRELLQDVGASHCFNSHPKMLSLEDQVRQSAADAWPTIVVRWMLRRNLRYRRISPATSRRSAEDFRFVVKAHELVTSARQKDDFASPNPLFLEPGSTCAVDEVSIGPCLQGLGRKAAVMLLQFPPQMVDNVAAFNDKLHRFLSDLPKGVLYAVELRNHELFNEGYRELLQDVGASHCFNSHPKMLSLEDQVRQSAADAWPTIVVRWMEVYAATCAIATPKTFSIPSKSLRTKTRARAARSQACVVTRRAPSSSHSKASNRPSNEPLQGLWPLSLISLAEEIVSPTR